MAPIVIDTFLPILAGQFYSFRLFESVPRSETEWAAVIYFSDPVAPLASDCGSFGDLWVLQAAVLVSLLMFMVKVEVSY